MSGSPRTDCLTPEEQELRELDDDDMAVLAVRVIHEPSRQRTSSAIAGMLPG
jgi:hypothetical protein